MIQKESLIAHHIWAWAISTWQTSSGAVETNALDGRNSTNTSTATPSGPVRWIETDLKRPLSGGFKRFHLFLPSNVFNMFGVVIIFLKVHWNHQMDQVISIYIYIYICPLYAPFYARVEPTFLPWEDECQEFEAEKQSLCIAGFWWASAPGRWDLDLVPRWGVALNHPYGFAEFLHQTPSTNRG